ncbi:hypothetical protein FPV67DRAFT_1445657 [Lyophyllum atratum]|nr:hypothetical protein FPV67DRAFT_1445657 [Lyophyllum atratum]
MERISDYDPEYNTFGQYSSQEASALQQTPYSFVLRRPRPRASRGNASLSRGTRRARVRARARTGATDPHPEDEDDSAFNAALSHASNHAADELVEDAAEAAAATAGAPPQTTVYLPYLSNQVPRNEDEVMREQIIALDEERQRLLDDLESYRRQVEDLNQPFRPRHQAPDPTSHVEGDNVLQRTHDLSTPEDGLRLRLMEIDTTYEAALLTFFTDLERTTSINFTPWTALSTAILRGLAFDTLYVTEGAEGRHIIFSLPSHLNIETLNAIQVMATQMEDLKKKERRAWEIGGKGRSEGWGHRHGGPPGGSAGGVGLTGGASA